MRTLLIFFIVLTSTSVVFATDPTTPVKETGDDFSAVELNNIVDSIKTKQDKPAEGAFEDGDKTLLDSALQPADIESEVSETDTTNAATQAAIYNFAQTGLYLDPDDLSDGDAVLCTGLKLTAGEDITLTNFASRRPHVYLRPDGDGGSTYTGGRIWLFNAYSEDSFKGTYPLLGYATSNATAGNDIYVHFGGWKTVVRADAFTSWVVSTDEGKPIYASAVDAASGGLVTKVLPTDPSDTIQRVGIIIAAGGPDIYVELNQLVSVKVRPEE